MHSLFVPISLFDDADEDIKTNSTVFYWPDHIQTIFEVCRNRLMSRREQAEDELKKRVHRYEEKLNEYGRDVDSFRKKEVSTRFFVTWWSFSLCMHFDLISL